jgi:hypothetical protein
MRNFTGLVGYPSCANALLEPGGGTIDTMKMKAKAANHRTMGISVVRGPRVENPTRGARLGVRLKAEACRARDAVGMRSDFIAAKPR